MAEPPVPPPGQSSPHTARNYHAAHPSSNQTQSASHSRLNQPLQPNDSFMQPPSNSPRPPFRQNQFVPPRPSRSVSLQAQSLTNPLTQPSPNSSRPALPENSAFLNPAKRVREEENTHMELSVTERAKAFIKNRRAHIQASSPSPSTATSEGNVYQTRDRTADQDLRAHIIRALDIPSVNQRFATDHNRLSELGATEFPKSSEELQSEHEELIRRLQAAKGTLRSRGFGYVDATTQTELQQRPSYEDAATQTELNKQTESGTLLHDHPDFDFGPNFEDTTNTESEEELAPLLQQSEPINSTNPASLKSTSNRKPAIKKSKARKRLTSKDIVEFPMYIWIPDDETHQPIESLPDDVRKQLLEQFRSSWTKPPKRQVVYARMTRNPATHVDVCVLTNVITHGKKLFQGDEDSACDTCVGNSRTCVRIRKLASGEDDSNDSDNEYGLVFIPLPESARLASTWKEIGYWLTAEVDGLA
ncbi:hypothetical protein P153DRAFT_397822 [Dothidotthia symphoricarpi CBS 119687]|uniref:Uncharacterized protein n=1 Tax=Dothidotthia symphoricarpi CBS 119687 TaxID=1392245 RepID=A0A6A6A7U0_9PLEO|nr:uncharacterized protein P153DRAFT_397822 [Dothidotthia symphoricarpi CBS 119687]KAF2127929.1 hypothetical protein P153DRAFT_397822 [Dothidotthia symphoricarpi CBS 119687]